MELALPKSGSYVVAVSGGVDSVVLLHALQGMPGVKLTVAHFDHGIRPDSREDRLHVQQLARAYGLTFVYDEGRLGESASEAQARGARYTFLQRVREASGAEAIITAHHQDDMLETAILNLLRGTGRKGLSSLKNTDVIVRPLLHTTKNELVAYAKAQGLVWREDSTNSQQKYLRNYVRLSLITKLTPEQRAQLVAIVARMHDLNQAIDEELHAMLAAQSMAGQFDRRWFISLPHREACELMAAWLRAQSVRQFDRRAIERLVVATKTKRPGTKVNVLNGVWLFIDKDGLRLQGLRST